MKTKPKNVTKTTKQTIKCPCSSGNKCSYHGKIGIGITKAWAIVDKEDGGIREVFLGKKPMAAYKFHRVIRVQITETKK